MDYAEVVNNTNGNASFEVKYLLGGKPITETSPSINSSKIRRIDLPCNAESITVDIYIILPDGKTKQIYHDAFKNAQQSCYEIKGSFKNPQCSKIDCSSLKATDWIDVRNKSQYAPIKLEAIYIIQGVGNKDESNIIKPGRSGALILPRNAGKVQFKIYMEDIHAPEQDFDVIHIEYFYHPFNVCFEVNGVLPYPFCDKVPCPQCNVSNNPPSSPGQSCCHCCCCCHMYSKNHLPLYNQSLYCKN
ncbi:hypothetical protein G8S49_12095 [Clostridium botulinum C]|uniref:Uncharacterized protein n=2 Tax=Clostridium botulinum TaxID=1491 RepID=A0A9Q4TSM7_CLOBO|nr:hypothetical protein [Clostridium botulinum]EGO88427.1 hypothetical protein CBCST_05633 [Clostridium botulinum C str. Stockholm]MCD3195877.1 hypothetical protein [Clostridium botulinum C]MCD3201293.1 hypothetical protein [Clostridium botulinum C]MCD3206686.1 hypothetical protein [Clostridium botulinum C]MCD3209421.1 hypothetical protein [Clostridium botulinum C]